MHTIVPDEESGQERTVAKSDGKRAREIIEAEIDCGQLWPNTRWNRTRQVEIVVEFETRQIVDGTKTIRETP